MKVGYSMSSVVLILMALSAVGLVQQDAFAQGSGMSITAAAEHGSDTILITGHTTSDNEVTVIVTSPIGKNIVSVDQITPDINGEFTTKFMVEETWVEDGYYSITAKQGRSLLYSMTVFVEVVDGATKETKTSESSLNTVYRPDTAARYRGLFIEADAVVGSTNIGITGITDKMTMDITLIVNAPNGNVVGLAQTTPERNGKFAADIAIGGPLWKQDGFYTVSVQQGDDPAYRDLAIVEIEDGVVIPEFGTIAAVILAVAIVSIIAVTARSRLSIMPRY